MATEKVILVDEYDNAIGEMEKQEVHEKGLLHRAFSVFIFNDAGQLLLQQRALTKYHSAGLWTNTCCSHPLPNEDTKAAAKRRLMEEMGLGAELEHKSFLIYKTEFENGLIENEYDHIFTGKTNQQPTINKSEVGNYEWLGLAEVKAKMKLKPKEFTFWFKMAMERVF